MNPAMLESTLPLPRRSGKVRDVYDLGDRLLIVATDRISAFDCIMPNGIPDKGRLLTGLSVFWFGRLQGVSHHLLSTDVDDYPAEVQAYRDQLQSRSMLVRKSSVIPIECVARGYLAGSGWKEYQQRGTVCGHTPPKGLQQCDRLPEPIFTPSSKEETGHDINIDFAETVRRVGLPTAEKLRDLTLSLYTQAADHARTRGVIIADTKFEFGTLPDGSIILIDEVLTPDSSRFWPLDQYAPGRDQPSFDKQFVRNHLDTVAWDKTPPAPLLPPSVIAGTRQRYVEAFEKLTGIRWEA